MMIVKRLFLLAFLVLRAAFAVEVGDFASMSREEARRSGIAIEWLKDGKWMVVEMRVNL